MLTSLMTSTATPATVAEMLDQSSALVAALVADDRPDDETETDWDRVFNLESAVLEGPILSRADAAAKLKVINLAFERSMPDSRRDIAALAQTIAWLEGHS